MLGWSINLFRVAGIRLAVHYSFFLLLAYDAWTGWRDDGWIGVACSTAIILLLFTCVTLHEFGHALTAQRFGIRVPRILLLPIGGMAQFETIPREPGKELAITIAGPAVNFAIVALLWPVARPSTAVFESDLALSWTLVAQLLTTINFGMGCFNLLPVFPMDGGRILRALLALKWPYLIATKWAVNLGKVLAIAGAVVMVHFFDNYLGALLFLFILMAGDMEYRTVKRQIAIEEHWAATLARLAQTPPALDITASPLNPPLPNLPEPPRLE